MRKLITTFATAGLLSIAAVSVSNAAPVAGFEAGYAALTTACSLPVGTVADCETQINAYSAALIAGGVSQDAALQSFTAVRAEVFAINAPQAGFQASIDELFERLLPNSGAIDAPAPAPAAADDGFDAPGPTSP